MPNQGYDDEIDLKEYINIIFKRWRLILFVIFVFSFFSLLYTMLQRPVYEAKATILMRSIGSNTSQYASIAGMLGLNVNLGGSSSDLLSVLTSKAVALKVIKDLDLTHKIKSWDTPEIKDTTKAYALSKMLKLPKTLGASGNLIEIKIEYYDSVLAADIANGYVSALAYYWRDLNATEAQKKLQYIDSELPRIESDLKAIEEKLKLVPRASTGLSTSGQSGIQRDYDIYSSVYTMLRKEQESAKLDASKEIPPFAIVDNAEPAIKPSKPNIKLNVVIGLVLGIFSGIFLAFFVEYWQKTEK